MGKIKISAALIALVLFLLFILEISGAFTKKGHKQIAIENGDSFYSIVNKLSENDIISSKLLFKAYAKLTAGDKLTNIRFGKIDFEGRLSYSAALKMIIGNERISDEMTVTIPEGYELREIADLLSDKGLIDKNKFYDAVKNHNFDYSFLENIKASENRLEGFLFPDTYRFSKENDTEITIIDKMLKRFDEIYSKYKSYEKILNMSTYEIITLASIIEREAMFNEDFYNVSSVFHNRLKRNDYLKYLQSCATVQYILKERKTVLSDEDTKIDSPYNTYKYPFLPVGPISSPGEVAIKAAVMPNKTDYLYFLNDKNGKLHFSKTFEEHSKLMRELL